MDRAWGASAGQWRALAEALGGQYDVEVPEHYGCGSTGMWSGEHAFTLADEAKRAIALIDRSEGKVHLVGHSYGGGLRSMQRWPDPIGLSAWHSTSRRYFTCCNRWVGPGALAYAEIAEVAGSVREGAVTGNYRAAVAAFIDDWNGPGAWNAMRPAAQNALIPWALKDRSSSER